MHGKASSSSQLRETAEYRQNKVWKNTDENRGSEHEEETGEARENEKRKQRDSGGKDSGHSSQLIGESSLG